MKINPTISFSLAIALLSGISSSVLASGGGGVVSDPSQGNGPSGPEVH